jgi:hypothetical protein
MAARTITNADKAACAAREVRMRRTVYPRFVHSRRLSQEDANREIEVMAAIAYDYAELAKAEKDAERLL